MRASFFVLGGGFLVGVAWRSFFVLTLYDVFSVLVLTVFVLGVCILLGVRVPLMYVAFFILSVLLGVVRTEFAYKTFVEGKVLQDGMLFAGSGMIVSELDVREEYALVQVLLDTPETKSETRLRVRIPRYPTFVYGERVTLQGEVHTPTSFETDTGRTFNYTGFLMKDGVQYELRNAVVESLHQTSGSKIKRSLYSLKSLWLDAVSRLLPEPSASLAGGVIVGAKQSLGEAWLTAFRDTGVVHIIVLSGYNLTLVANTIFRMTSLLPRAFGFGFGVCGVMSFAVMVGGGATVLRASCMAIIGMLATFLHRPYMVFRALVVAALVMVCINPFIFVFDPGFQLSFLATLGLIFVSPLISQHCAKIPSRGGMREIISATLGTQLLVLPLLIYQIGSVSLVAPLVNVLVLPVVPTVMLLGFIGGVVGIVSISVATPFMWLAYFFLSYIFSVVHFFSGVPYASVSLPKVELWFLVCLYALLFILMRVIYKTPDMHRAEVT